MRAATILLALALAGCNTRCSCHQGHTVIHYQAAHSTTTFHKVGDVSFPITHRHPASCSPRWTCDVRCSDWDKGQAEAHLDHPPHTGPMVVDPRCHYDPKKGWIPKA